MVVLAEFFALLGAFLFGLGTLLVRRALTESNTLSATVCVTSIGTILFWVLTFMLVPLNKIDPMSILLFALAGLFMPGFGRLIYYKSIETLGASMTASIFAIYPLFSSFLAIFLLNEQPSLGILVGMICVICGVVLIERNARGNPVKSVSTTWATLVFPLSSALLIGFGSILRKMGLNVYNEPILGIAVTYLSSLCLYTLLTTISTSMRKSISMGRRSLQLFWKPGLIMGLGHLSIYYALSYGEVSTITPLMNVQPFFILLLAYVFLRELEKITPKLIVGALIIVIGASLITIF